MAIPNAIQTLPIDIYQQQYTLGELSRPLSPHAYERGAIYVPSGGDTPELGQPVYYDAGRSRFAVPTTALRLAQAVGLISASYSSSGPIKDEDGIELLTQGFIVIKNGANVLQYRDYVQFNTGNRTWEKYTPTAVTGAFDQSELQGRFVFGEGLRFRVASKQGATANALVEIEIIN